MTDSGFSSSRRTSRRRAQPGRCPEAQALAAYVDGNVAAVDREGLERHLATCDECYEAFSGTIGYHRVRANGRSVMWWRIIVPASAVAAAASLALAVALKDHLRTPSGAESELVELVAAVGTARAIEPRLTGGFAYGPVTSPVRSGESDLESSS